MKISIDVLPTGEFPYFDLDTGEWSYFGDDGLFHKVTGPSVRKESGTIITLDRAHTRFALPMHLMPVELKTEFPSGFACAVCGQMFSEAIIVLSGDGKHMGVLARARR